MLQNFSLFIGLCVCVQSGFAQIISDVSNPRQFNFNLKDSQGWSAELQRINFTKSQVGADHEFGMMQFQSADGSLQINSLKLLKGISISGSKATCRIQTDSSKSISGITDFQDLNNNQVQKFEFHDSQDLAHLHRLVTTSYTQSYETKMTLPVLVNGATVQVPLLKAECTSPEACAITVAPIKITHQGVAPAW